MTNNLDKNEELAPSPERPSTTFVVPTALKTKTMGSPDCSNAALKRSSRQHHRRCQTIVAAGDLELQQLQKLMQMEVLRHDLESKSKELEESQEEAHLAVLIGQSLLQRTEEMGAEIESTAIEVLEEKLAKAYSHIRSMEVAKAKTVDESVEISQEVETLRMQVLKAELAKAHDETQQIRIAKEYVDDELESTHASLAQLQATHARLLSDWKAQGKRVQELEAADRYNLEHISRLEIENQSICLQHRMQERKEKKLVAENESMMAKMRLQKQFVRDAEAMKVHLEQAIETLNTELDDLKDALSTEQLRVSHLTKLNKELRDSIEGGSKPEIREAVASPTSSALRRGSLFYELSMQLKEEMRQAQIAKQDTSEVDEANQSSQLKLGSIGKAAKPLNLTLDLDSNNDSDDNDSRQHHEQQHHVTATRSQDEEDILKEFAILLFALAVFHADRRSRENRRRGLGDGTCNILNADLYEEAMNEGLTFDQYHAWLERRLEGTPELSVEKKAAAPPSTMMRKSAQKKLMPFR
ncbi:hypothetical protein FI667_g1652, partial [Globisporangium splendens]